MAGTAATAGDVIGRVAELEAVDEFLSASTREFATLRLEGEAGIGKSTLWLDGVRRAGERGFLVLQARPAESEARLSFAALADLLAPVDSEAWAELPVPQREALGAALLRESPASAHIDERAVCAGVLSLVKALGRSPLIIAVDDAQWLDAPSARALAFAARRLRAEPVGLFLSIRKARGIPATFDADVAPERRRVVEVGRLSTGALHTLVKRHLDVSLSRPTAARIGQVSDGNPFYALEIAREIDRVGIPPPGQPLPIPDDRRELVLLRMRRLPRATRDVLARVAVQARPTAADVDLDALAPAERAGVVRVRPGGRVEFTHPLFGSALYSSLPHATRREIHRDLAEKVADREQRARHLALAADGPSEEIAVALDGAAQDARERGAPGAAAELAELALGLTLADNAEGRWARALTAGGHHFHDGDLGRARSLADRVLAECGSGPLWGDALSLLGEIRYHEDSFIEAVPLLEAALEECTDEARQVALCFNLVYAQINLGDVRTAASHAQVALALAATTGDEGLLAVALAFAAIVDFYLEQPIDREQIARALALEQLERQVVMPMRPSLVAGIVAHLNDDLETAAELFHGLYRRTVDRGEESDLPLLAAQLAMVERLRGNFAQAFTIADEGCDIARMLGSRNTQILTLAERCYVRATRGEVDAARADAAWTLAASAEPGMATVWLAWASAFLALSVGDAAGASGLLEPVALMAELEGGCNPLTATFLPDKIEALVALGELDRAERLAAMVERHGRLHGRRSALASAGRARALVLAARGDITRAASLADEALSYAPPQMPFERARTLFVAGQVNRRQKQKRLARSALEEALAIFEDLGARLWAERTRSELARVQARRAPAELSATELEIAQLAAAGLTNKAIAERVFVSGHTVEKNLARAYQKLGIHSRAQLATALEAHETEPIS